MARLNYTCKCGEKWSYQGNTATTFRNGGVQTWANSKDTYRGDLCPACGDQGETEKVDFSKKNIGVNFTDNGTGKKVVK